MNRKGTRKMLPLVMAAILAFSAFTFTPGAARADVAGAAGPVGLPGTIDIGTASASPTEVGFNGKLWQVIGYDGTGVASAANDMTLLLKSGESYGTAQFNSANYNYYDSTYGALYLKMADIYTTSPLGEKALIQDRDIDAKNNDEVTETVPNQNFWPLSTSEAQSVNSTVREFSAEWWLRSPSTGSAGGAVATTVTAATGFVHTGGHPVSNALAVRPAFNLNLSSVLFTSGAASAGAAGPSGLAAYTAPTGALKFTALDIAFSGGFGITETAVSGAPGTAVTLNYTGAATGASHFIRVKLVNDALPGQIAYASVPVSNIAAADGNFSLTLPAGMPMGTYTVYAWVEEGNGANLTNRGSVPDTFTLTVQPNVTFSPSPGSINLSNPINLVFQADAPALLSGYAFIGVAFQNNTAGTGFGMAIGPGEGVTYNPATGALTVPAAAFGQHVSVGGGSPLTPGNYRAQIQFWDGVSFYFDYYADFVTTDVALSSSKDITAFSINGVNGAITEGPPNTIALTLPYGTDVTNLAPLITHTGASVSPASGAAQSFTSPVTYTVTAQDGSTKDYNVTVSVQPPPVSAAASVSNATVSGTAGSALGGGQRATITLTGETVAGNLMDADASGWFTGLPAGITVIANASAGGSTITLTFGGTPTAASAAQFNITIPGSILTGGSAVAVAANPNARFSISGAPQPPSPLPKTGDGFPLYALLALMGVGLIAMAYVGTRLRKQRKRA